MDYVLQTQALCKHYRNFKALDSLTMNVPKGAIYGFVGKNGSGKTTLIRLISGLQTATAGEYTLYGRKNTDPDIQKSRHRMGAVVELPSIYLGMTAMENLKAQYRILGLPSYDDIPELLELVGIPDTGKKKAKHFSLGMRQRLGIAIALAGNPDFLVLDEPINGLDPQGIIAMRELLLKLKNERQITILISSHILEELSKLATHYGFIDHGRILREISAEELENACRKCCRIEISDTQAFARVMEQMDFEYSITDEHIADIYGDIFSKITVTDLAAKLSAENCEIHTLNERDESLESYFINLVGGEDHEQTH